MNEHIRGVSQKEDFNGSIATLANLANIVNLLTHDMISTVAGGKEAIKKRVIKEKEKNIKIEEHEDFSILF